VKLLLELVYSCRPATIRRVHFSTISRLVILERIFGHAP